jgi:ubiquinone/menaquinone biosynthesis C-methylase UbiE
MSTLEYHLTGLEIAAAAGDPRKILPKLPPDLRSILDLGCGAGQTLMACKLAPEVFICGVDVDEEPLRLGKTTNQHFHLVCAVGEELPFAAATFDMVISRVALPYMHIPSALAEIARVVRPGGRVWFTLHPLALTRKWLLDGLREANLKKIVYLAYAHVNGWLLHFSGRQFRYPLKRERCESFQSVKGITRALHSAGFKEVKTELTERFFVVTAVKA